MSEMQVDYISHMGTDKDVADAARVSFDKVSEWDYVIEDVLDPNTDEITKQSRQVLKQSDAKLIKFLSEHNHWSPFSHAFIKVRVTAPIFVARQLAKHMVGFCLSGDTEVTFVKNANGASNGTYKQKISDLYKMWSGQIKYQGGEKGKYNIKSKNIRVYNEDTKRFEISKIVDVIFNGVKDMWQITDEFDNFIKATEDHKFLTDNGWKELKELKVGDFLIHSEKGDQTTFRDKSNRDCISIDVISRRNFRKSLPDNVDCNICKKSFNKKQCECDHIIPINNGGTHDINNLQILCKDCHRLKTSSEKTTYPSTLLPKLTKIKNIAYAGKEDCYDLSVDRIHNFLGNGFVVHNCWNEVSRRYVSNPPEFYIPENWRKKHESKKQGSYEDIFVEKISLNGTEVDLNESIMNYINSASDLYDSMVNSGVCPEQARMILPQNMQTSWIWSGSLYAFARMCNLRLKPDTQFETRQVAEKINDIVSKLFPVSWGVLIKK